jgi:hypothetical protein
MSAQIEKDGLTLGQFGVLEELLHLEPMIKDTIDKQLRHYRKDWGAANCLENTEAGGCMLRGF